MKALSIKLDDTLREGFDALCESEKKTQPAMFASLMASYTSKPAETSEIEALQGKLATVQAELQAIKQALTSVESENAVLLAENKRIEASFGELQSRWSAVQDDLVLLQGQNADLVAELDQASKPADLTSDIKELSRITTLENAIHEYGKGRVRARFGNTDMLSKDEAVEAFIKTNTPR